MKHIQTLFISIFVVLILASPITMAAPTDFSRTSAFVQGYADYLSQTPSGHTRTVTMTVTSNNPDGVVTYIKQDLSKVTLYFGQKSSYFIEPSKNSPIADQYYSNKLWDPARYGGSPNNYILFPTYPFDPKATAKKNLLLLNMNIKTNQYVAAYVGSNHFNVIEDHGLLRGFGKQDPSTMYVISLRKNDVINPR